MMGFYHQPRFGRPALALDLMEPFRPLVVDSAVVTAINTKMVTARDFVSAGEAVSLTAEGRKGFYRAYELRMDTLVTHPIFGYRVNYRRLLEVQVAPVGEGAGRARLAEYPGVCDAVRLASGGMVQQMAGVARKAIEIVV